jgi:hypothetical protein
VRGDTNVRLERDNDREVWTCVLNEKGRESVRGTGRTAREAIRIALEQAGVELPG